MKLSRRGAILLIGVLFVSLALNFVAAGFLGSQYFWSRNGPTPAERLASLGVRQLPTALRGTIVDELAQDRVPLRDAFRDIRSARVALIDAMRAEPYDPDAVKLAFDGLRQAIGRAADLGEAAILRALAETPEETRRQIEPLPQPPQVKRKVP